MKRQLYIHSDHATHVTGDGYHIYYLPAHFAPDTQDNRIVISLADAWIPHTFYTVHSGNDQFNVLYNDFTVSEVTLSHGNYSIDGILAQINPALTNDFELVYNENRNRVSLQKVTGSNNLATAEIVAGSTCTRLLGFTNSSLLWSNGVLEAASCVNMVRTTAVYVRTSLHTENRDPISRNIADVLGKIPVDACWNEIITYHGEFSCVSHLPHITAIAIKLVDDNGFLLDLNGCPYSLTLEISSTQ